MFIIVCVGAVISFIVLPVELFVASFLSTIEDNPGAPRMVWNSLNARNHSAWHDWRHQDDVPEMPQFVSQWLDVKHHGTFGRQRRRRTESSEMYPNVTEARIKKCREY